MMSSVVRPRRSFKSLPKAKLAPKKKVMVTVWWSAAHLIHYSFLNPGKTITSEKYAQQIVKMHQKPNACSQNWSTKWAQFFSTIPDCPWHNQSFKRWTVWAMTFCLIHHIHLMSCQLTTTPSSISTFCKLSTSATNRMQKMHSKSLSSPEAWIFTLQK